MAFAAIIMLVRMLFIKGGMFVNSHVGSNPNMKKLGIGCAKSIDTIHRNSPTPGATRDLCGGCKCPSGLNEL